MRMNKVRMLGPDLSVSASVDRYLRLWLLAAKTVSARRGSRMRSTGEADVRKAHVLDACLVVSPKIVGKSERRIGQCRMGPVHAFTNKVPRVVSASKV